MVDLHCHPNLKSFHSGHPDPTCDLWQCIDHSEAKTGFLRMIRQNSKMVLKHSQCNMYALHEGAVRVINLSLYPMEHGFLRVRDVPSFMLGKNNSEQMISLITGMDSKRIKYLRNTDDRYFDDLQKEYEYVAKGQGRSPDGKLAYKIVNNYAELKHVVEKEPDTIAIIMNIEGAHAFGCGVQATEKIPLEELKTLMSANIRTVKNWEHPPLTVNLAHHFWNQLSGHATSLKGVLNGLINQSKGLDKGLTELGRHVCRELLSRENGKRIYIDTKHMSVAARMEYYGFIRNYNYLNPNDKIPVICSHGGVNGYKDLSTSLKQKDTLKKSAKGNFHKWSINVCNEEIRIIHESEGLIGIMMDKGNLGSVELIKRVSAITDPAKQREEFARVILNNIFQVVKAVEAKSGWDIVSIGTDYDGTITHVDPYDTSAKMPLLREDLVAYLYRHNFHKELWYGYTPEQLIDKVFSGNAMRFYEKYFV